MDPFYKEAWDYITNSPSLVQALIVGASFFAGLGLYNIIDKCADIKHLRKGKQSKLEKRIDKFNGEWADETVKTIGYNGRDRKT